jgi:hypothetical protein
MVMLNNQMVNTKTKNKDEWWTTMR